MSSLKPKNPSPLCVITWPCLNEMHLHLIVLPLQVYSACASLHSLCQIILTPYVKPLALVLSMK